MEAPTDVLARLEPPRASQYVYREDMPLGIDVCLHCFNGSCAVGSTNQHALQHRQNTGHEIFVNIQRRTKPAAAQQQESKRDHNEPPVKRLAIREEPDERDQYEFVTCARIAQANGDIVDLNHNDKLDQLVTAVVSSMSSSQKSEVKAWEEEIMSCTHTNNLVQPESKTLEPSGLAACAVEGCGLTSNLWLCLVCGALGCGRQQFGGGGGNGHALAHTQTTGHAVAVKLGTIEPDGSADVYCYACDDAKIDPHLAKHLDNFGIQVEDQRKTEKSMTELQVEQNLKFDFAMTGADGKGLQPLEGPGLTGLRNLGNSCYMASSLQTLFSLPTFQERYLTSFLIHTPSCMNPNPATCFECQMSKMADGLLSGRYAMARRQSTSNEHELQVEFQEGIKPSMFKSLIGKDHVEFSTMKQQDAGEFLTYLLETIRRSIKNQPEAVDPTKVFGFRLEQRVECLECHGVRYKLSDEELLPIPVPVVKKQTHSSTLPGKTEQNMKMDVEQSNATAETAETDAVTTAAPQVDQVEYEQVELTTCLDDLIRPTEIEYKCPACSKQVKATKSTRFASFPDVLLINAARFQIDNWVPRKVDVPLIVSKDQLKLDSYMGQGKQDDEVELPQDEEPTATQQEAEFNAEAMIQLQSMGFPEIRCKRALLATGNQNAELAMNWLFEHMEDADIDAPLPLTTSTTAQTKSEATEASPEQVAMLCDMGFTSQQATKALRQTNGDANRAVEWLFSHPDDDGSEQQDDSSNNNKIELGSKELPALYRLKAFVSHKGPSVHSGHYVAHVRFTGSQHEHDDQRGQHGRWVLFNDEKVVDAEQGEQGVDKLMPFAYVYMFERIRQVE
ncbi:ubiquitin C-terminal hydrolase Ubp14 [Microbotryomycetes sp. JL221]|nr:ubiquitin C-terminal hydrolase Ubp14 [Microbotryomycetes sp. JL221]